MESNIFDWITIEGLVSLIILIGLAIGLVVTSIVLRGRKVNTPRDDGKIIASKDLHAQVNRDRERRGEPIVPAINNYGGTSSNNLARRDKSWSSVPDFFIKMFKK